MERIREKVRQVGIATEKVEDNLPDNFDQFKSMELEKDGINKNVETAIQASFDIFALIVKEENLELPGEEVIECRW